MFNRRDFNIINSLVDFPFFNRSFKIWVFPKFNFSIFSSSNNILSIFVNIKSIYRAIMSSDWSLTLTKNWPNFKESIPTNSGKVIVLRILRNSKFRNSISMSWFRWLSLELSKSIPNSSFIIKSSWINNFRINWNTTRINLFGSTKESLF